VVKHRLGGGELSRIVSRTTSIPSGMTQFTSVWTEDIDPRDDVDESLEREPTSPRDDGFPS